MSDQDIFNNDKNKDGTPSPSSDDVFADKLKNIVGEDGKPKYDSVEKALEALAHSQAHIKTLEDEKSVERDEIAKLREELEKRATVEDFVNKLSQNPTSDSQVQVTPEDNKGLDESKVLELLQNTLQKKEESEKQVANVATVVNTLKDKFGDNAGEEVAKKAKELGMTTDELKKFSATNPQLVLGLFGEKEAKTKPTTPSSTSTANPTQPQGIEEDNKKKLLRGGITSKDLVAGWNAIGKDVYDKFGVET